MNVLVVIWSVQIGGAETFSVELCKYLKERSHKAYLLPVLGNWDEKFFKTINANGIRILSPFKIKILDWFFWKINRLSKLLGRGEARLWINKKYLLRVIKSHNIDLIVSNSSIADSFVSQSVAYNIPKIVIEHGEYSYSVIDKLQIDVRPLHQASAVVAVSDWCRKILHESFGIDAIYISNGRTADSDSVKKLLTPLEKRPFIFAVLGRGIEYKGWEDAIESFLVFIKRTASAELWLIGDGSYLSTLKQRYAGISQIKFLGKVIDPLPLLHQIDVGIMLSRKYEAFGIVLLEFFSLGKPVIATAVGAIPEVLALQGDPGGILVQTNEEGRARPHEVVLAMQKLYEDETERQRLSARAKQIASHFSFARTGLAYESLFKKVINQHD